MIIGTAGRCRRMHVTTSATKLEVKKPETSRIHKPYGVDQNLFSDKTTLATKKSSAERQLRWRNSLPYTNYKLHHHDGCCAVTCRALFPVRAGTWQDARVSLKFWGSAISCKPQQRALSIELHEPGRFQYFGGK